MTDLLLYFALCFLAAIVVCAALFWLTRPAKVDKLETTKSSFAPGSNESGVYYWALGENINPTPEPTIELSAEWDTELQEWLIERKGNEGTHPIHISMQDITGADDYEGIWGESALTPHSYGESAAQREQINRWVNEAWDNAGEDFEL